MMGFNDEMYYRCDRHRKVAEKALDILWEKYRVLFEDVQFTYPEIPEGFDITLDNVRKLAEEQIKFDEDFSEGVKHGERCTSTFGRVYSADIKCDLPIGHDGTHRGDGLRWAPEAGVENRGPS